MAGYQKKANKNLQKITILVAVFLVVYILSQLWGFANVKLRYEQVMEDTLYDFVRAEGIVFRSEELISDTSSGTMVYQYADGEEVAKSQEVAAVYQSKKVSLVNNQIEQLKKELNSLQKAQTVKATRYSAITSLSGQINDQAGKIADFVADGVVEGIVDQKEELTGLLNRKKIALGEEDTFTQRIRKLNAEISYLEKMKNKEKGVSIIAPEAGYFCQEVDGYESIYTPQELEELTYDRFQQLKEASPAPTKSYAGKIVKTHVWNVGVSLPNYQAQKFEVGAQVKIDFKFASGQTVAAQVVKIVPDDAQQNSVVIFECKDITDQLLKVRRQSVDIIFTTYSGLRINSKVLYHEQNIPGVYVLDKTTIRFKPVEIVKDNGSFILCEPRAGTDEAHTLHLLDLVITESGGVSLKDGTILDEDTVKGVESNNAGT